MFNRENIRVRPLSEELEGIGLDPDHVMDDIERNAGLLEQHFGSPPSSEAVRGRLVEEETEVEAEAQAELADFDDDDTELDLDEDETSLFDEAEVLDERIVVRKKGMRKDPKTGKLVKVSIQQRRQEKRARMEKRGSLRAAARAYRKRFKTKIAKRRKRLAKKPAKKGMIRRMESTAVARLSQLREELETSSINTGEVTPYEEAAINAGWLALLLGECFEAMGDVEAGEMLYAMGDSAAVLSENIEALEGELDEATEAKLAALLEGISKALATHEDLGSPSLFESIEMGAENGLYEDEEEDDEELIDEDDDCECDVDDDDDEEFDLDDDE
jgi:hypothetical protein